MKTNGFRLSPLVRTGIALLPLLLCSAAAATTVDQHLPFTFATTQTAGRTYSYTFSLYAQEAVGAGEPLWGETFSYRVPATRKITHPLGSVVPLSNEGTALAPVDFSEQLWVEVRSGAKLIGSKRTKLVVAPYALWSAASDAVPIQQYLDSGALAAGDHAHEHGLLTGLDADDHPQYLNLAQDESVEGRPAFNGGASGATAPFTIDSTTLVANLNADLIDGKHAAELGGGGVTDHGALTGLADDDHPQYFHLSQNETVTGRPAFNGGVGGASPPFTVSSNANVARLNADLFDGKDRGMPYTGVAVVSQDASAHGYVDPADAMANYERWCGVPSPTVRCLLKIMPGLYLLEQPLVMIEGIDVEGSGVFSTELRGRIGDPEGAPTTGLVVAASGAELRHLTVRNQYAGAQNVAIFNNGRFPTITDVEAHASGGAVAVRGLYNLGGGPRISESRFYAYGAAGATTSFGIDNDGSQVALVNVYGQGRNAMTSVGIRTVGGSTATFRGVSADAGGPGSAVAIENVDSDLDFADISAIAGADGTARGLSVTNCSGIILRNIRADAQGDLASGITISGSHGTVAGVKAYTLGWSFSAAIEIRDGSDPLVLDGTAEAQASGGGGSYAYGVYIATAAKPALRGAVVSAMGEGGSWGIKAENASASMTSVSALAIGSLPNVNHFGLQLSSSGCAVPPCYTSTADNCSFSAAAASGTGVSKSVTLDAGHRLRMGASALSGALANGGGVYQCVYNYNADTYAPLSCP